jgi:hypothetical protein
MNAQTVTIRGEKTPFAVRFLFPVDNEPEPIKQNAGITILPEIGGILYNIEFYDGLAIKCWTLKKPVKVGCIKAKLRAEVWETQKGERKKLYQEWFAAKVPEGYKTLTAFIGDTLAKIAKGIRPPSEAEQAVIAEKPEGRINIRPAHKIACEKLLRQEYPQTCRAFDNKLKPAEVCKAFIADMTVLNGVQPGADINLLQSPSGVVWIRDALNRPGRKISAAEWTLALSWIRDGLYKMAPEALAKTLNERTGLSLKGEAWYRRARRMGLVSDRRPGAPEKHALKMR